MGLGLGEAKPSSWPCGLGRGRWKVLQCGDGHESGDEGPLGAAPIDSISPPVDDGHQWDHCTECSEDLIRTPRHAIHPCVSETEEAGEDVLQHSGRRSREGHGGSESAGCFMVCLT